MRVHRVAGHRVLCFPGDRLHRESRSSRPGWGAGCCRITTTQMQMRTGRKIDKLLSSTVVSLWCLCCGYICGRGRHGLRLEKDSAVLTRTASFSQLKRHVDDPHLTGAEQL